MQRVYGISICLIAVSGESAVDLEVEKIVFQLPTQPLSPTLIISNVQVKDVGDTWHLIWTCIGGRVNRRPRPRRSVIFSLFSLLCILGEEFRPHNASTPGTPLAEDHRAYSVPFVCPCLPLFAR